MSTTPAVASANIEARTIRKLTTRIIPFVFALFMVAFLDRINIGFAALTMNRELAISSRQFGWLAGIFFFGYFVFEVPSNLLLEKIGARVWLARILISWGMVAVLTGLVKAAFHLYILRFLLGVAEAGYIPGILLYLTYWFRQRQLAQAMALFCMANPVASVVGSPLSGVILDHVHWLGVSSWRWLLILEGLPAIVGGIFTWLWLPDRPASAGFLTAEEKDWISNGLAAEQREKLAARQITAVQALMHPRVWYLTAIYFSCLISMYAMTFWMPQLVKAMFSGHSNTMIGTLVMVPYLAAVPAMLLISRSSDRSGERRYHIAVPLMIGAGALFLLSAMTLSPAVSLFLWCVVAAGIYSLLGPFWTLPNEFLTGYSAAAGIALINSVGNLGGFVGPYMLGAITERTGSVRAGLAFSAASLLVSAVLMMGLRKKHFGG